MNTLRKLHLLVASIGCLALQLDTTVTYVFLKVTEFLRTVFSVLTLAPYLTKVSILISLPSSIVFKESALLPDEKSFVVFLFNEASNLFFPHFRSNPCLSFPCPANDVTYPRTIAVKIYFNFKNRFL
jgi:hypothetical protein